MKIFYFFTTIQEMKVLFFKKIKEEKFLISLPRNFSSLIAFLFYHFRSNIATFFLFSQFPLFVYFK